MKSNSWMSRLLLATLLSAFLLVLFVAFRQTGESVRAIDPQQDGAAATSPVVVELFTSEGCSSCPPADKLLSDLEENQPVKGTQVIALSEHVDYWNRLGWKDPFSSAQFTERQTDYSKTLGNEDIYTPQMVVDGRTEFVGNQRAEALEAIGQASQSPKASVEAAIKAHTSSSITFTVQVGNVPDMSRGDKADVMLAITESGLMSNVLRGENSGRKLAHSAVTRKLATIGTVEGGVFKAEPVVSLNSIWKRARLRAVIFVQERASHRILGAAAIRLEGES